MDTLPPELLLYLIPFFPLSSLVAARGVNTRWRSLAQVAPLHPARKVLLDLYLTAIVHPNFPSLAKELQPHVHEFDRKAYIADLISRGCVLPDLFEIWVLEWPSKAVHFWAWPGLAADIVVDHKHYYDSGNALRDTTSIIDTIPVPKKELAIVGHPTYRGLMLWQVHFWCDVGVAQLWLVVDANERVNDRRMGRLLWTYSYSVSHEVDETGHLGPKRIFYDTPFGPRTDFKLIDFFDLLNISYDRIDLMMAGYYITGGVRKTDDDK